MQNKDADLTFFQEWWKIFRKYQNPPKKEDNTQDANVFWNNLVNDCRALSRKYESSANGSFYVKMTLDMISEVERRSGKGVTDGEKKD